MKKFLLIFLLASSSERAFADLVNTPTGSPVSDVLLLAGVLAIAALLFVRYRRSRNRH
ncbi:MAG: hypothetical protein U0X91_32045 [Spirosomataceae bacterium]